MPTIPVHVRVDEGWLTKLEQIGAHAKPKPLNRSEMLNVAVEAYARAHWRDEMAKPDKGGRTQAKK
jgi:hypothetical protein